MLNVFKRVFDGIVDTMSSIEFLGITLWDYSVGLSILALGIAVFLRFFIGDHK